MMMGLEHALANPTDARQADGGAGPTVARLWSVSLLGLTVLIVSLVGWGCALLPQFTEPPATGPVVATADTTRARVPDPELWPTAEEKKEEEPARTETTAPAKPRAKGPTPPIEAEAAGNDAGAPADTSVAVAPAVTVSPPKQAVEEIETETIASLREAKRLLAAVKLDRLDPAGQEKLRIVRGFITQAEEALQRQDIEAASGLARKARLLAVELSSY